MKLNLNIDDFLKILIINLSIILVIPFNLILINKNFIPQLFDSSVLFSFIIFFFYIFIYKFNNYMSFNKRNVYRKF